MQDVISPPQIRSITEARILRKLAWSVAKERCRFLEVGSWKGESTHIFAEILKQYDGRIYCVDWWQGNPETILAGIAREHDIYHLFWEGIVKAKLVDNVVTVKGRSEQVFEVFKPAYFDLIFIDGDHTYPFVKRDIEIYSPLVKDGGIHCGHDCEGYKDQYEAKTLEAGKLKDFTGGLHCGVILAVGDKFGKDVHLEHSVWSVRKQGKNWVKAL